MSVCNAVRSPSSVGSEEYRDSSRAIVLFNGNETPEILMCLEIGKDGGDMLRLPGGRAHRDEIGFPFKCVVREFREETTLRVRELLRRFDNPKKSPLRYVYTRKKCKNRNYQTHVYVCFASEAQRKKPLVPIDSKVKSLHWVSLKEVFDRLNDVPIERFNRNFRVQSSQLYHLERVFSQENIPALEEVRKRLCLNSNDK